VSTVPKNKDLLIDLFFHSTSLQAHHLLAIGKILAGSSILPHNRVVNGLTGRFIPDNSRFALIGDTHCDNVRRFDTLFLHHPPTSLYRDGDNILRVVLYPTIIRKILRKFSL
jgi:hypothetical protein